MLHRVLERRIEELERELAEVHIEVCALRARVNILKGENFGFLNEGGQTSLRYPPTPSAANVQLRSQAASRGSNSIVPEGTARAQILKQIGQWIRRALDGQHRGLCGRELLPGGAR